MSVIQPTQEVWAAIDRFVAAARKAGLEESRLLNVPDGGLAVYYFAPTMPAQRYFARVSCVNDETTAVLLLEKPGQETTADEMDIDADANGIIRRIREHIGDGT